MRQIKRSKRFLKDLARAGRYDFIEEIDAILYYLVQGVDLPAEYDAHPL